MHGFSGLKYIAAVNLIEQVLKSVPGCHPRSRSGFDYVGVSWSFFIQVFYTHALI
jgi:hypothetical protein